VNMGDDQRPDGLDGEPDLQPVGAGTFAAELGIVRL
jgi:hypothetical protein